jgi:hypothetical protein
MYIHRLHLDSQSLTKKPEKESSVAGNITSRIIKTASEPSIEELAYAVGQNGQSFTPAYFEGRRSNDGWRSQSVFVLDFDKGISFREVMARLQDNGLDCTFAYKTLGATSELEKFRVVWQTGQCIIDKDTRNALQDTLMGMFPECDKSCKDAARFYYGGKGLHYENYSYVLAVSNLVDSARLHCALTNGKSGNLKRALRQFDKKGVLLCGAEQELLKNDENSAGTYIYNSDCGNLVNSRNSSPSTHKSLPTILRCIDFENLRKIKVFNDFMAGKKLIHPQLLGIATNLRWIEGGQKLFNSIIDGNPEYDPQKSLILSYAVSCDYLPQKLEKFSPYPEDFRWGTIHRAAQPSAITRLNPFSGNSLDEARQRLKQTFHEVYWGENEPNQIHNIKGVTGIGKTELSLNLDNTSTLIACPNHALKEEIATRMKGDFLSTPNEDDLPTELKSKREALFRIGAYSSANALLNEAAKKDASVAAFRDKTLACYSSNRCVLTTHPKAIFISWENHNTIIFDEDPIQVLLPIQKISISDLYRATEYMEGKDKENLQDFIIQYSSFDGIQRNSIHIQDENCLRTSIIDSSIKWDGAILDFFFCDWWVKDTQDPSTIHFITRRELPPDKKIIILSATADESIYHALYGDRVQFHDLSKVESSALIEQHTNHSMSRSSLPNHLDWAKETVGSLPVITFQKFKNLFSNPVEEAHFGKCTGIDGWKGQDISVVGTPHPSPITVALYGAALGILEAGDTVPKPHRKTVTRNGFSFPFKTYDTLELQELQFYFIENDLRQAIGRARPYSESCKVTVLSNYPLPEAYIVGVDTEKRVVKCAKDSEVLQSMDNCSDIIQGNFGIVPILEPEHEVLTESKPKSLSYHDIPF